MKHFILASGIRGFLLNVYVLVILGPAAVNAQQNEEALYLLYGDEDMVSIATGMRQPITRAPSTATIITADDIKAMGAITLDEVLEAVPGLHVIPSTLDRMNPVYTIRGIYTGQNPQVLFMLNGHRIASSLFTGGISVNSKMNVENISRIEVIRGPGSAIYGADAYAGVINIVTKNAGELDGMHYGARGGSFSTKDAWVQYGGALNMDWDVMFHVEHARQDADTSRVVSSDFQSVFDNAFMTSASLAPSYLDQRYEQTTYNIHVNSEHWNFGVDGWVIRDRGIGSGIAQALDHSGFDDFDQFIASAEYVNKDLAKDWEIKVNLSYQEADINSYLNIFPPGAVLPIGSDGNVDNPFSPINPPIGFVTFPDGMIGNPGGEGTVTKADITVVSDAWIRHSVRVNIGAKREEGTTRELKNFGPGVIDGAVSPVNGTLTDVTDTDFIFLPDSSRTISYLSLQDVWQLLPDWILTAGVRYDDYSDFGSTTNPRLALVWNSTQYLTSKLLYGRAFRAPSFSELYSQNNPVVLGNPNLKPETIDTLELGFAWHPSTDLTTSLSIYQYKTEDMIDFIDPENDGTSTAQNSKSLDGQGFELEIEWAINNSWDLTSSYVWQSTEDRATGIQEAFIPERQFYIDARWQFITDWRLSTQLNWIADRDRIHAITGARENVDGYTWVNLTLRRSHIGENWELAATVKNLFDEDALEPSDGKIGDNYPLNERAYFVEARYAM